MCCSLSLRDSGACFIFLYVLYIWLSYFRGSIALTLCISYIKMCPLSAIKLVTIADNKD